MQQSLSRTVGRKANRYTVIDFLIRQTLDHVLSFWLEMFGLSFTCEQDGTVYRLQPTSGFTIMIAVEELVGFSQLDLNGQISTPPSVQFHWRTVQRRSAKRTW